MAKRAECPVCGMSVALNWHGKLMIHGRKRQGTRAVGEPCKGTGLELEPSNKGRKRP